MAVKGREGEEEPGGARVGRSPVLARGGRGGGSVFRSLMHAWIVSLYVTNPSPFKISGII
jgi:hypothetical protein